MKENKIPSTVEVFLKHCPDLHKDTDHVIIENIYDAMVEFTKLHVKAALEAAAENAFISYHIPTEDDDRIYKEVNKKSILSAYPEELIK